MVSVWFYIVSYAVYVYLLFKCLKTSAYYALACLIKLFGMTALIGLNDTNINQINGYLWITHVSEIRLHM